MAEEKNSIGQLNLCIKIKADVKNINANLSVELIKFPLDEAELEKIFRAISTQIVGSGMAAAISEISFESAEEVDNDPVALQITAKYAGDNYQVTIARKKSKEDKIKDFLTKKLW